MGEPLFEILTKLRILIPGVDVTFLLLDRRLEQLL